MAARSHENLYGQPASSFENYLHNLPFAIIESDDQDRILLWSGQAEQIFGWNAAETLGQPINQSIKLVAESDLDRFRAARQQIELPCSQVQVSNYTKTKHLIRCQWYNSLVYDPEKEKITILSLVADVTERKRPLNGQLNCKDVMRFCVIVMMTLW